MEANAQLPRSKEDIYTRTVKTELGEVPFLKDLWSFFSSKGVKTNFITINPEYSFQVDLEICESLGCPIQIYTDRDSVEKRWGVIAQTLKTRKIAEEDAGKEWLKGVEKKWILPKNIQVKAAKVEWSLVSDIVKTVAASRIDILKVESNNESERMILYSLIESGARPGVILVQYTVDPDANVPAMLVAGHLQNTGYRLLGANDGWFLYVFNDKCLYESCSWRDTRSQNPLVQYICEEMRAAVAVSAASASVPSTEPKENPKENPKEEPKEEPKENPK